jgi:hypothetical protein
MPLLQYLAYYQTIEYYFPTYSQADARRRLRNILKDPSFRPDRDADLGRLLAVTGAGGPHSFTDERSQLRATLYECLDPSQLRDFICETDEKAQFFKSKAKGLTEVKIPLADDKADLRDSVAERIYDIRCKIVHTKLGSKEGEVELLLPFSPEADLLYWDIDLVQYVARNVLIAASSAL